MNVGLFYLTFNTILVFIASMFQFFEETKNKKKCLF